MKVVGILSVSNFVELGYPVSAVVGNLQGLCDKVLLGVDPSYPADLKVVEDLNKQSEMKNIRVVESVWDRGNISGGSEIALQMDTLVFTSIKTDSPDWVVVLQADEFLHERDFPMLREFMLRKDEVDGFCMERLYFWENLNTIREDWNHPMVRIFRPGTYSFLSPGSTGDGMTTGKLSRGEELTLPYKIYHYSRVGDAKGISKRIRNLDTLFHPEETLVPVEELPDYDFVPRRYDNYSKAESLEEVGGIFTSYNGSHPKQALLNYGKV